MPTHTDVDAVINKLFEFADPSSNQRYNSWYADFTGGPPTGVELVFVHASSPLDALRQVYKEVIGHPPPDDFAPEIDATSASEKVGDLLLFASSSADVALQAARRVVDWEVLS